MAQPARAVHAPARAAAVGRRGALARDRRPEPRGRDRRRDHPQRGVRVRAGAPGRARDRGTARPAADPRARAPRRQARRDRRDGARPGRPAAARRRRPALCRRAPRRRGRRDRHVAADGRVPAGDAQRRRGAGPRLATGGLEPRLRRNAVHGRRRAGGRLRHGDAHAARQDRRAVAEHRRRALAAAAPGQPGRPADRPGRRRDRRRLLRGRAPRRRPEPRRRGRVLDRPARRERARGAAADDHARARGRRAADGQAPRARQEAHGGRDARLDGRHLHGQDRHADRGPDDGDVAVAGRRGRSSSATARRRPAARSPSCCAPRCTRTTRR